MSFEEFKAAADRVHNLKLKPLDEELLEVYGLYKQAEVGDVNTDCPNLLNLKERAKWNSWNSRKGLSQENARKEYIYVVGKLVDKYGVN